MTLAISSALPQFTDRWRQVCSAHYSGQNGQAQLVEPNIASAKSVNGFELVRKVCRNGPKCHGVSFSFFAIQVEVPDTSPAWGFIFKPKRLKVLIDLQHIVFVPSPGTHNVTGLDVEFDPFCKHFCLAFEH